MFKLFIEFRQPVLGLGVRPGVAEGEVHRRSLDVGEPVAEAQDKLTIHRLETKHTALRQPPTFH